MKCTISAPAKLNLFLDITGKRSDGYHLVNMVMQSVSLCDDVTVSLDEDEAGITVECTDKAIPCDRTNTAYRAAEEFFRQTDANPVGVRIRIKKRIPSQAGMAGGSTDAAAVLLALNQLLGTGLSPTELAKIAEAIGADVPFCVYGGTMKAEGIGTLLSPLPDMPDCYFIIVKPDVSISTASAYRQADDAGYELPVSAEPVISGVCSGDINEIAHGLYNRFEDIVQLAEISSIKQRMTDAGALGACMTGSGSAVFGIFDDKDKACDCRDALSETYPSVFLTRPQPGI